MQFVTARGRQEVHYYLLLNPRYQQPLHLPARLSQDLSLWNDIPSCTIDCAQQKLYQCDCCIDFNVVSLVVQELIEGDCMLRLHSLLARMEDGFCFQQTLESRSFMLFHCQTGSASSWSVLAIVRLLWDFVKFRYSCLHHSHAKHSAKTSNELCFRVCPM